MIQSIVLLTGPTEAPYLEEALVRHNPALVIRHAEELADLEKISSEIEHGKEATRLIAFSTNVIVPETLLNAFSLTGYNFHPGPPEYPGSCPANFAIYEQSSTFGVTAHTLTPVIDGGDIVAVRRFPIEPDQLAGDLQQQAYTELIRLFYELAPALATAPGALKPSGEQWQGHSRTRAEASALSRTAHEPGLSKHENYLRKRAFHDIAKPSKPE